MHVTPQIGRYEIDREIGRGATASRRARIVARVSNLEISVARQVEGDMTTTNARSARMSRRRAIRLLGFGSAGRHLSPVRAQRHRAR